ncbi:hypothetical protein O6H91_23G022200 [Diphasiastrum complanatum]|uniref:Uncharacterized protein n=1 Tax=Diphasiastrum complanatum TaxID=34168 RepID=A0ACC2A8V0_DIPCM|nr:hypothetical protein O6H91_Y580400 [Diphasiastrum complanatum]KAJ7514005.1 hypothetical protein O6H91_23G022200 [Diphasiastrum complanatum]
MDSSTPGSFLLKVTPELMLKIVEDEHLDGRKKSSAKRTKKQQQQQHVQKKVVPELGQAIPTGAPYLPGPFRTPSLLGASKGPVPAPPPPPIQRNLSLDAHAQKIAAYSTLLEKTEKLASELQKRGAAELDEINRRAQELNNKQYRAPIRSIPCVTEREACLQCYKENGKEPLKCKQRADAFLECARRAQTELASAVL